MIITLGRDSSFRYTYILCIENVMAKGAFLQRAKVKPDTYAGELIAHLYDAIFVCSLDLKRDFTEYYAIEIQTSANTCASGND